MDADCSHDPKDIPTLLSSMDVGDGLAIGSRYCKGGRIAGWPIARRWVSRIANTIARSTTGLKLNDFTSGFRCYSTKFLAAAIGNLHCTTYEIQIETAKQVRLLGFGIKETPILFVKHKAWKIQISRCRDQRLRFLHSKNDKKQVTTHYYILDRCTRALRRRITAFSRIHSIGRCHPHNLPFFLKIEFNSVFQTPFES